MNQPDRIISLDQFRGYSVAGMFLVNFLGHFPVTHHVLKHNNTHFSYADSIMPSFILICGYSYRMTFLRRSVDSPASTIAIKKKYLLRSLGLILLSLMLFGFGGQIDNYSQLSVATLASLLVQLVKANMWEVLSIIGACQIILLPLIDRSLRTRVVALAVLAVTHVLLTWWFNWDFVYGLPNTLDSWLGTSGKRAWDGGFLGLLSWSEIMMVGTMLPDLIAGWGQQQRVTKLLKLGVALMLFGYSASCLTRLYDKQTYVSTTSDSAPHQHVESANPGAPIFPKAFSPVLPDWQQLSRREWNSLFAEPPFVPPPPKEVREPNYWAMDKRIVSQSFVFFSAGFAILAYALFVRLGDEARLAFGPFTTFGQNPLAAYIIHHFVTDSLVAFFPKDSQMLWATLGMFLSMWITHTFVAFLSKRGLYLRL